MMGKKRKAQVYKKPPKSSKLSSYPVEWMHCLQYLLFDEEEDLLIRKALKKAAKEINPDYIEVEPETALRKIIEEFLGK